MSYKQGNDEQATKNKHFLGYGSSSGLLWRLICLHLYVAGSNLTTSAHTKTPGKQTYYTRAGITATTKEDKPPTSVWDFSRFFFLRATFPSKKGESEKSMHNEFLRVCLSRSTSFSLEPPRSKLRKFDATVENVEGCQINVFTGQEWRDLGK